MESVSVVRYGIAQGGSRGFGNRARQELASGRSRWCDGAGAWHIPPSPASHRHGTATPGVHMEIIVKFSEALPCVKSLISRTAGPIYVVT